MKLLRKKFFAKELVLVDGHTRTGKSCMSPILSSFEGVEILTVDNIFEHLSFLYHYGKVDKDGAISLLRCQLQQHMYYTVLSRNINFKFGDFSGIFKNVKPSRYIKRLFRKDKDALKAIEKESPLIQIQTHDVLAHPNLLFEAFGQGLKIIEMVRHPISLIYSNYSKGYGKRESTEPTKTIFTIEYENHIVPWYAYGWEDKYIAMSQMDRVVHFVEWRLKNIFGSYHKLNSEQKKQIVMIPLEKFLIDPTTYIKKIEDLIGRKSTRLTKRALKRERCPRVVSDNELKDKEKIIKELASKESIEIMERLSKEYEKMISNL